MVYCSFQQTNTFLGCLHFFQQKLSNKEDQWGGFQLLKGHPPSADLRYGEKDSISPSTQIFFTFSLLDTS